MALDFVHHNLHSGKVSIRPSGQPGGARRVTITADWAIVRNARPNVSAAGWRRTRTAGANGKPRRSVHADIRGTVIAVEGSRRYAPSKPGAARRITYNPNRFEPGCVPVFHYVDTGEQWRGSTLILVTGGYAYELQP